MMTPSTEAELAEFVAAATGPLRIVGGDTRGMAAGGDVTLSTVGLSGIVDYEPGALTLIARAGTPLAEIQAALAAEGQRLAFEPMDHRVLLGTAGQPTIGGVVAANVSGPRRVAVGACRDHMLGLRFVDGTGTVVKNGGRVMKNVTGYDLVKLLTGSYGTLGVLSEVSLKVLPTPETTATLVLHGLSIGQSVKAMSDALGSPYEVTGAAMQGDKTFIRIEGFEPSVAYRFGKLRDLLGAHGDITRLDHADSEATWHEIANVAAFRDHAAVTRVSVKPSAAPEFADCFWQTLHGDVMLDWGGGLMWFGISETDAAAAAYQFGDDNPYTPAKAYGLIHEVLQHMAALERGHATLLKAPEAVRAAVRVFQPEVPGVAALSAGIRAKFDPKGIFNPGMMG